MPSAPTTKRPNHGTGAARREALRRKRERQERLRRLRLPAAIGGVVVVAAALVLVGRGGGSAGGPPAGAQSSFGTTTKAAGDQTIDGIPCEAGEQLTYHVHAHLAVYVDGKQETIPQGIGTNPDKPCIYWLHTHTADGLVHVEAPSESAFTLGQLFDVWGQPLAAAQVASAKGAVTAFVDGQPYTGDLRAIPLKSHTDVQLDVGSASPAAQAFSFPSGT